MTLPVQTFTNVPLWPFTAQTNQAIYVIVKSPRDICESSYWVRLNSVVDCDYAFYITSNYVFTELSVLGGGAVSQSCKKRPLASSRLSVRPSAWKNSTLTGPIQKILYLKIFPKSVEKIRVSLKSDKNNGYPAWTLMYTYVQLCTLMYDYVHLWQNLAKSS